MEWVGTDAMQTAGALLLTWSIWWVVVVGSSVPARRPFFKMVEEVPSLVRNGATGGKREVFEYVLAGGWPTQNSALRISAASLAVVASFSFAFIATLLRERTTRSIFAVILALTSACAAAATALDALSLARTAMECAQRKCVSEVPPVVAKSTVQCMCAPDGWFWVTLAVDSVLLAAALACLALTVRPLLRKS